MIQLYNLKSKSNFFCEPKKENNLIESVAIDKHKKIQDSQQNTFNIMRKLLAFHRHFGLCHVLFRKVITIKLNRYTNINILNQLDSEYIYRKIPKISPRGLYFSKALFEGLIFGGAYIYSKGLIYGGKLASQNRLGQPYSWK